MSQIIRLVRDGIGQIWWEIWTGTYCFAGWILSLNPSKWKSCNVYSLCVAASWGGRYLCFKSQQNDWSLHTHTLVFIPLRYKSPPLFRCFLLTFLLKWTKWCSRCLVGGGVVCLRMWGGGSPVLWLSIHTVQKSSMSLQMINKDVLLPKSCTGLFLNKLYFFVSFFLIFGVPKL